MFNYSTVVLLLTVTMFSCNNNTKHQSSEPAKDFIEELWKTDSLNNILSNNVAYIADSLLHCDMAIIKGYVSKYQADTCGIITYIDTLLKSGFEGVKALGDINGDKVIDSAFIIPPFNYCDDGESYYFYDTTIPRLQTDSYCCQPDNLFTVDDIDEDGIREIGIFYSPCSGRYKSIRVFSLKNSEWVEIGTSDFDVLTKDPETVQFHKLVKKLSKGTFQLCGFFEGYTEWETIKMK